MPFEILWSNLIGGIRLQVQPEDIEIAEQVLASPPDSLLGPELP